MIFGACGRFFRQNEAKTLGQPGDFKNGQIWFIQHKLSETYDISDFGLYRDDGLAIFKNISGPDSERIKKHLQSSFREHGLEIVIECNKTIVHFLDITMNLNNGTYQRNLLCAQLD